MSKDTRILTPEQLAKIGARAEPAKQKQLPIYNPERGMCIGTTHALELYDRTIDLGRDSDGIDALGEFLAASFTDIPALLGHAAPQQERAERAEMQLTQARESIQRFLDNQPLLGDGRVLKAGREFAVCVMDLPEPAE